MSSPSELYTDFVARCGGIKPIRRILVANNGMAATKFILSVRNWLFESFGDDRLVHIIAMATAEDIKANAAHLHAADSFFEVPGGPNFNNYANVSVIVSMASLHEADAVWPGWGHASENPALPRTLEELGITFIGPSDNSMFLLGDKIASTIIAQSATVPCVSWSGSGVTVEADGTGQVQVPDDVFARACVNSAEEALAVAESVGYPVMIKASEGGGGKGVRKAMRKEDIEGMYRQVVDEVKGSPVFLMRLCNRARHVEIQLLSDKHKNVAVLSVRRHARHRTPPAARPAARIDHAAHRPAARPSAGPRLLDAAPVPEDRRGRAADLGRPRDDGADGTGGGAARADGRVHARGDGGVPVHGGHPGVLLPRAQPAAAGDLGHAPHPIPPLPHLTPHSRVCRSSTR